VWAKKHKKRAELLAQRYKEMEEETVKQVQQNAKSYTSKELTGLRVGHDLENIGEGGEILVLKDSTITENEG
jgi:U4/U6.U5 tri-snRNP-associated protein 1